MVELNEIIDDHGNEIIDPAMAYVSSSKKHTIWIRQAMPGDAKALLANMRKADQEECKTFGMSPGRALKMSLRQSLYAKSAWLDGEIIAMIGLCGSIVSAVGHPWMLTGNGIEKVPFTFARVARRETDEMLKYKSTLFNRVAVDYPEAVRFLKIIGFSISDPEPVGKNGAMLYRAVKARP